MGRRSLRAQRYVPAGFPPPPTPLAGGDNRFTSPTPISVHQRIRALNPEDTVYETHESYSREHLDVDPEGGRPILGSHDSANDQNEPEPIHAIPPPPREYHASPVIHSRLPSQYSHRSASQYSVYLPPSQYSRHLPSQHPYHSPPNLTGAEQAAREYLDGSQSPRCSSPVSSVYPPSVAASAASQVYRASRPAFQVRRLEQIRNTPRRRVGLSAPTLTHQNAHDVPPVLPQPEARASGSIHSDRPSTAVSFGPTLPVPQKDRLRPMVGIDRYEKAKKVVIEDIVHSHVCPPVTTEFVR